MIHFVYALVDPRIASDLSVDPRYLNPLAVLYVGMTTDLNTRYQTHLGNSGRSNQAKIAQIDRLLAAGVTPLMVLLEVVYSGRVRAGHLETEWIHYFLAKGSPLLNKDKTLPRAQKSEIFDRLEEPMYVPANFEVVTWPLVLFREYQARGISEKTYWVEECIPAWMRKNGLVYWVAGRMGAKVDSWASLGMLPLSEQLILSLLSGRLDVSAVSADDVYAYEPGNAYTCYVVSAFCADGKERVLSELFRQALFYLSSLNIHINRIYTYLSPKDKNNPIAAFAEQHLFTSVTSFRHARGIRLTNWQFSASVAAYQDRIRVNQVRELEKEYGRLSSLPDDVRKEREMEIQVTMYHKYGLRRIGSGWEDDPEGQYINLAHLVPAEKARSPHAD